ncbi:MAG TPA: VWA domain-containing protein [Micromonosporaceae bacterium]|nr:VWA domain-containing protein [Micromonosporaceae bacterium]
MSGRHRPAGAPARRSFRTPFAVLGVAGLVAVTAVAVQAVTADAEGCSTGGVRLTVAADPAIAPALKDMAHVWTEPKPKINSSCIRVEITETLPADLASSLGTRAGGPIDVAAQPAATPRESDIPTVWIPDSTFWLNRVLGVDKDAFELDAPSVALSPVVLGVRESAAAKLGRVAGPLAPDAIKKAILPATPGGTPALKLGVAEPRRETTSLAGALLLKQALVKSQRDLKFLVGAFRQVFGPAPDNASLVKAFGQGIDAAPLSEQAVIEHNAGSPAEPVAAVPVEDAPTLDFPYAIMNKKPRDVTQAASRFRSALAGGAFTDILARHGLRAPDGAAGTGFPTGHGVAATQAGVLPINNVEAVRDVLGIWVAAKTPSRVLALVDVTQSMASTMTGPNGNTAVRMNVLRSASAAGLPLFTNDSQLGMWAYAAGLDRDGGRDYKQAVPIGPLNPTQRDEIGKAVGAVQPVPTDVCAMFETLLDAYKTMKEGYDRKLSNTIVVFTDGRSNKPGGLDLKATQRELERMTDITRPIRVILLGIGPDADMDQLDALAKTTGGRAFEVSDPAEIDNIFLQALLR